MIRSILLQFVLPFVFPMVVYLVRDWFARRHALATGTEVPPFGEGPWGWLAVCGLGLVILGFLVLGIMGGSAPGEKYVPPAFVDGEIVPGRTE